jgi:hypothetical protein
MCHQVCRIVVSVRPTRSGSVIRSVRSSVGWLWRRNKSSREASAVEGVSRLGTDREQAVICRGQRCGEPDHVYMSI